MKKSRENSDSILGSLGYSTMPLLNAREVDYLLQAFRVMPENSNQGFYTSLNHQSTEERLWVDHCLKRVVGPKVVSLFKDYEPLFGTFTIKKPGDESKLAIHLDWSVVDEEKYHAIGVWIPLCEVSPKNGAFGLLERSFTFGQTFRGSMINFHYAPGKGPEILRNYTSKYKAVQFSLNAGTAILYDMRTAHFSSANKSNNIRIAANLVLIPRKATPLHYYKSKENEISVFSVDKEYFLSHFLGAHDVGKSPVKTIEITNKQDIEEQHQTDVSVDSIRQIDLRNKTSNKAGIISAFLNRIWVKYAFRKFMKNKVLNV